MSAGGADRARSTGVAGRRFFKMTGSGNDFLVFDVADGDPAALEDPQVIRAVCARGMGVGADGIVILDRSGRVPSIRYYNADGTRADLCGNATLCSVALSASGGRLPGGTIRTDAGELAARLVDGVPEVQLEPIEGLRTDVPQVKLEPGERRAGFAVAGVPHLVILCDDLATVPVEARGPVLRRHPAVGSTGANVNWVGKKDGRWAYRTFERGVEGETLACGTGAVVTAALLAAWGAAKSPVELWTSSNRPLVVTLPADPHGRASLRGEGRLVFEGKLVDPGI